jgi:hypothetical protein
LWCDVKYLMLPLKILRNHAYTLRAFLYIKAFLWWSEVKWSEVMILGEMCVLSLIYGHVAVCRFCAVRCIITIYFPLLFFNYSIYVLFNIIRIAIVCFVFLFYMLVFCVLYCSYCSFAYCFFSFLLSFPVFMQVYWPLPPGANPIAVNKCHQHHQLQWLDGLVVTFLFRDFDMQMGRHTQHFERVKNSAFT